MLIGLMGVGKTTVGRVLAERLERRLVDSDDRIEELTGRTAKQILADDGVDELRRHEADALFDALIDPLPLVVAAAGGVVLAAEHRRRLAAAGAHVVWLDADPSALVPRTLSRAPSPLARRRSGGHTATYAHRSPSRCTARSPM